jgi:hypothetical protein
MVEGKFALPTVEGEALLAATDALTPPPAQDDERTASQRRADALGDLARSYLESPESPVVGGERPHINVHVDVAALSGLGGGLHETDDGFVLDPFAVSWLVCDGSVSRVVFGPGSEILDVGRRTRVVPAVAVGQSWPVTATVSPPAVAGRPAGATFITWSPGRRVARPRSTISASSVVITTPNSTSRF